jgi:hypothetical protein
MFAAKPGDTLIVRVTDSRYDVIDAVSGELIMTTATLWDALDSARRLRGDIWRQLVDEAGRAIGDPIPWMAGSAQ